jgi:hypothetical protein
MGVAAELAQEIGQPPDSTERIARQAERQQPGVQRLSLWPETSARHVQERCRLGQTVGLRAEDPSQLTDGALRAGGADCRCVGDGPPVGDGGHHDGRVEHAEGSRDYLAGHLAEHGAPTAEVRRAVGQGDLACYARARRETQPGVQLMAFGREVHVAGHGLEDACEDTGRDRL